MGPIRNILVAVDFHAASLRGIDYAVRLARSVSATITVLHAFDVARNAYPTDLPPAVPIDELRRVAEAELAAIVDAIARQNVRARAVLREGSPAHVVVAAARDLDADLVVVGTHGRRCVRRLVLGSVAEQVVRRCAAPVVTVHEWHFESRADAARHLARKLAPLRGQFDVTIAITRGAVPIATELAGVVGTPVDALVVEPIPVDDATKIGAVAGDGSLLVDDAAVAAAQLNRSDVARATKAESAGASEPGRWLAAPGARRTVTHERVLLVADELASPEVALVAARTVAKHGARHVSLAVPVCASSVLLALPSAIDSTLFVESTQLESPYARIYRDELEPSNIEAAEMLARAGRASAHIGTP